MNKIDFNQTGGFPLSTNILDAMQDAFKLFNSFSEIAGKNCIISGCEINGVNVGDGIVVINGEILPFKGAGMFANASVVIREDVETRIFEDASVKPVIYNRYATIATAGLVRFDSLIRIKPLSEVAKAIVPLGLISMWSGSLESVPIGWKLCNGQNGTPNLMSRFVVGAGQDYNVGDVGGYDEVVLTENQMPSHKHTGVASSSGSHTHVYQDSYEREVNNVEGLLLGGKTFVGEGRGNSGLGWGRDYLYHRNHATGSNGEHSHELKIDSSGGSQSHENRPPYFALAYIMYTG